MPGPARRLRGAAAVVAVIAAIGVAHRAAAAPDFHADPAVAVVGIAVNGSGSGAIVLHNDGTTSVIAGSITAEPGCDAAAVHLSPLTGFTLAPGMTRALAVTCSPAPASMQRCSYQVRSPANAVLVELEAVCAYAGVSGLSPDSGAVDLGAVPIGGQAARTIALRNTGTAPINQLFIETTDLAGNFQVAAPCNPDARECDASIPVLAAGASTSIVVACTPRAIGPQAAELHLVTSAGTRLATPIALTCSGLATTTPVLSVSPGSLDVGAFEVATQTAATTVHVTNTGAGMLKLLAVGVIDDGTGAAADWTVAARTPCTAAIPPICILNGGQTADLDLTFDPRSIGVRDAALLINYHDTADRSISVPLHGAGIGPTIDVVGGVKLLDFGALPLGTAGTLTFQVANHGTRNLTDGMLAVMPAGPPFAINPATSFTATTASPSSIAVTCTPTAAGTFSANLQLSAPDVAGPPTDISVRCTGDPAATLVATPPAVLLGEVRIGTPIVGRVMVTSLAAPIALTAASLETAIAGVTVRGAPATTPATLDLTAAPQAEASLEDRIMVTASTGPPLAIPVAGAAVTASYSVPAAVSLGTFCVQQPTTPRILSLSSTGTATIAVSAPALASTDSPFDLVLVAPTRYPNIVTARQSATVAATPKRRSVAGLVGDDLIWTTDVAGATVSRTTVTATFIDDGGAIAPGTLAFGQVAIHVDIANAQQVTLQNCSGASFQLDAPQVPTPFSIDSPSFPTALSPGEIATFSVGFHPTKLGNVNKTLTITSPQLHDPLVVGLSGEGVAPDGAPDAGANAGLSSTSFYACGGCTTGEPSAAIAFGLAALGLLRPRRRRRAA